MYKTSKVKPLRTFRTKASRVPNFVRSTTSHSLKLSELVCVVENRKRASLCTVVEIKDEKFTKRRVTILGYMGERNLIWSDSLYFIRPCEAARGAVISCHGGETEMAILRDIYGCVVKATNRNIIMSSAQMQQFLAKQEVKSQQRS